MKLQDKETATYLELDDHEKELEYKITESTEYLFEVLTKKYYSWKYAWLRELLSNAFDAHIAAGKKDIPISIQINSEKKSFSIRDRGTGIDPDKLEEVYLTFGNSTRRNSNKVIGYYGFGSKAPFMMTDAFKVINYWNGKAYHCLALYTDKPRFIIEKVVSISEPNGLEIIIENFEYPDYEFDTALYKYANVSAIPIEINGELHQNDIAFSRDNVHFCMKGNAKCFIRIADTIAYDVYPTFSNDVIAMLNICQHYFKHRTLVFDGLTSKVKLPGNRDDIVNKKELYSIMQAKLERLLPDIINEVILPGIWNKIRDAKNIGFVSEHLYHYNLKPLLNMKSFTASDDNLEIMQAIKAYFKFLSITDCVSMEFGTSIEVFRRNNFSNMSGHLYCTFIPNNIKYGDVRKLFNRISIRELILKHGPKVSKWYKYRIPNTDIIFVRFGLKNEFKKLLKNMKKLIPSIELPEYFEYYVKRSGAKYKKKKQRKHDEKTIFPAEFIYNARRSVIDLKKDSGIIITEDLSYSAHALLREWYGDKEIIRITNEEHYKKIKASPYSKNFIFADKDIKKYKAKTLRAFNRACKRNEFLNHKIEKFYHGVNYVITSCDNVLAQIEDKKIRKKIIKVRDMLKEYKRYYDDSLVTDLFNDKTEWSAEQLHSFIFEYLTGRKIKMNRWVPDSRVLNAAVGTFYQKNIKAFKALDMAKVYDLYE